MVWYNHVVRCLKCHYSLTGLRIGRCPECGREFDPADPTTFGPTKSRRIGLIISIIQLATGAFLLALLFHFLAVSLDTSIHPDHGVASADWGFSFKLIAAAYLAFTTWLWFAPLIILAYLIVLLFMRLGRRN